MKSLWWIKKNLIYIIGGCTLLTSVGCSVKQESLSIYVSAAASLTEPLKEIVTLYQEENKNVDIHLNLGATSTLKNQILQGAQVDVFLSASSSHYEELVEKDYIEAGEILGKSEVVLIAPKENKKVNTFEDLVNEEIKLLLTEKEVPIGMYSEKVLALAETLYGEGFKQKALEQVVSRESNVKQVLSKIMMQDADCGFVSETDLAGEAKDKVKIIPIPERCKVQSTYWMWLMKTSKDK